MIEVKYRYKVEISIKQKNQSCIPINLDLSIDIPTYSYIRNYTQKSGYLQSKFKENLKDNPGVMTQPMGESARKT